VKTEIISFQKKIVDEFEAVVPEHKTDLDLLSKIETAHTEAKDKLETLILKNKHFDEVVTGAIAAVVAAREATGNRSVLIEKQFEKLDAMRIQIVKRAKMLGELKSKIPHQPNSFTFAWSPTPMSSESSSSLSDSPAKKISHKAEIVQIITSGFFAKNWLSKTSLRGRSS
jgi:ABC-type proline/glycine betaine transport system substrate-binding protein